MIGRMLHLFPLLKVSANGLTIHPIGWEEKLYQIGIIGSRAARTRRAPPRKTMRKADDRKFTYGVYKVELEALKQSAPEKDHEEVACSAFDR